MGFSKDTYLKYDPFSGCDRDVDIRCHTVKICKVRKPQPCMLASLIDAEDHEIKPGQLARVDKAICDGEWGSYYCCMDCMDKWLAEEIGLSK